MAEMTFGYAVEKPRMPFHEPSVIDENMMEDAIQLERQLLTEESESLQSQQKEDAGGSSMLEAKRLEEIELHDIQKISLSFRRIHRIENLEGFTKLRKLQLDNNFIGKIENLETLVNLEWLDISNNKIKKIEGLDNLTKLTDLSFANNQISVIEGLDLLTKLDVLSLAGNQIAHLSELTRLRKLKKLEVLSIADNPLTKGQADVRGAILARLPNLQYLDYKLVTDEERETAFTDNRADVEKLKRQDEADQKEAEILEQQEKDRKQQQKSGLLRVAKLWETMVSGDDDRERLMKVPDMTQMWNNYQDSVAQHVDTCMTNASEVYLRMEEEMAAIDEALCSVHSEFDVSMKKLIDRYQTSHKHTMRTLDDHDLQESDVSAMLARLRQHNQELREDLVDGEVQLNEMRTAMLNTFESAFGDLVAIRLDAFNKMFRAIEKEEQAFRDDCKSHILNLVERVVEGQPIITTQGVIKQDELPSDVQILLQDREGALAIIGTSHDYRMARLLKQEDLLRLDEKQREKESVQGRQQAEHTRTRARMEEIGLLFEHNKQELNEIMMNGQE